MIWLLRHGDAADGSPDDERPLTEKGERQSRAAGAALARLGVELDDRLKGGPFDPEEVALGHGENLLLVGHDPDFSMAVHGATGAQVRMKKGGLAAIHKGELIALLRPDELQVIAGLD